MKLKIFPSGSGGAIAPTKLVFEQVAVYLNDKKPVYCIPQNFRESSLSRWKIRLFRHMKQNNIHIKNLSL